MNRKNLYLFLLLLSLPFLQGFQCDRYDGYEDIEPQYSFKETASLSPYQLNYKVGDTIWLQVNIPDKKLFDEKTGTRVFFDSALFKTLTHVQMLYNNPFIGDGPFARFVFPIGVSASTNNYSYQTQALTEFGCAPSRHYNFSLGIVLLKQGVLGISFLNSSIQQCETENYRNAEMSVTFDMPDLHKDHYLRLPFDSIGRKPDIYVLDALERKTIAVIQVN